MLRSLRQAKVVDGGEDTCRDGELATIIGEGIDWEEFLLCALRHRVSTLVLNRLRAAEGLDIPDFVLHELTQRASRNRFRSAKLMLEATRIHRHLGAAGLRSSTLKGAGLSSVVYGKPDARHIGDLDILVDSADIERQILLLRELGYERINPICRLTTRRLLIYRRYWKDLTFRHTKSGIDLDLHWRLFNNRCSRANCLVRGVVSEERWDESTEPAASSRVDQFLYCAVHGCHDAWVYLKGLADVANFLELFSESEVENAFAKARELQLLPQLSCAVHLASEWVGVERSCPDLLPWEHPYHQAMLQALLKRFRQSQYRPERRALPFFREAAHEWRMIPGMASLQQILGRYLWRPRIWSMIDLPDWLLWVQPMLGLIIPPRFDLDLKMSLGNPSINSLETK
jgi:hypothetical protein